MEVGNVLYLFSQLWSRVEIMRKESVYVEISRDETGKRLREFLTCMESTGVRVVDRARQRAVGEALISERKSGEFDCLSFHDFMETLWANQGLARIHRLAPRSSR